MVCYKNEIDLDTRVSEYSKIRSKYIDRIPVIIDFDKEISKLNIKRKYLVPDEISCSYFIAMIRQKIKIDSSKGLFIFCNNKLLSGNTIIREVYDQYCKDKEKDPDFIKGDQFLYFKISFENTFGSEINF